MSLETQSAVMRAGNNEAALKALAISGNMDAIAALKKLLDAKSSRDAAARQAGLAQPETPPVLDQIVGQLGPQEYAAGGRVRSFQAGGTPFRPQRMTPEGLDAYAPPIESSMSAWLAKLLGGAKAAAHAVSDEGITDRVRKPNYGNEGNNYPAPPPTTPMQRNGTATPTPTPAPATKPRANVGIAPNMEQDTVERDSGPRGRLAVPAPAAAPDVKDMTDEQLAARLAELTPLQKEREALRTKSREQLEAAYNAKVKNLTPSTYDRFMDFMAGVSAKGGSSAAQALGAGALAMHAKDKGRKEQMASVKEMYDKSDLLLQEAALADKERNFDKANALRKEAAALQDKIADQKSTDLLRTAQARKADADTEYIQGAGAENKRMLAEAAMLRAKKPTGSGLGAGAKVMTQAQRTAAILKDASARATADGKSLDMLTPANRDAYLAQAATAIDKLNGAKGAASPAAPKSGFKIIGVE